MGILRRKPGENVHDHAARRKERRANHMKNAREMLTEAGIRYTEMGPLFLISHPEGAVHFWPQTGRWKFRVPVGEDGMSEVKKEDFGIKNMIAFMKG